MTPSGEVKCKLPVDGKRVILDGRGSTPVKGCERGQTSSCWSADKPCMKGSTKCVAGHWLPCGEWQPLQSEKPGDECSVGKGACEAKGRWRCQIGDEQHELVCDANATSPREERCNGLDDDCDGKIDGQEEACYSGSDTTAGVGLCRRGKQRCEGGQWGPCRDVVLPEAEVCDGKDNDCDGAVDEELFKECYDGPPGTKGVGPCRAGKQLCVQGKWGTCEGAVVPAAGQTCEPTLQHSIGTSYLSCEAKARSRACELDGTCELGGSEKQDESRISDPDVVVRCRGNNSKKCGVFSSEGLARREVVVDPKNGDITLNIGGFAGSCSCNSWCDKGCNGQSGCCLSCSITERDCRASASYLGHHRFSWKKSLPRSHRMILHVMKLKGSNPQFEMGPDKDSMKRFSLKEKQRCLVELPAEQSQGVSISISDSVGLRCGGGEDFEIVLRFSSVSALGSKLPSCM